MNISQLIEYNLGNILIKHHEEMRQGDIFCFLKKLYMK